MDYFSCRALYNHTIFSDHCEKVTYSKNLKATTLPNLENRPISSASLVVGLTSTTFTLTIRCERWKVPLHIFMLTLNWSHRHGIDSVTRTVYYAKVSSLFIWRIPKTFHKELNRRYFDCCVAVKPNDLIVHGNNYNTLILVISNIHCTCCFFGGLLHFWHPACSTSPKENLKIPVIILDRTRRRRCRRDETVLCFCEHNSQLADDDCRRIRLKILKLTKQTP